MNVRSSFAGLILAIAVPLSALAHGPRDLPDDPQLLAQYREGFAAYQREEFATAREKWRLLAEQGSSAAQLFLGFMHAQGQGAPRDAAKAIYWYSEAAERDNAVAQVRLAIMYRDGTGEPADRVKALLWLKMAGRAENHMQSIARAMQRTLEADMSAEEIAAAGALFDAQTKKH